MPTKNREYTNRGRIHKSHVEHRRRAKEEKGWGKEDDEEDHEFGRMENCPEKCIILSVRHMDVKLRHGRLNGIGERGNAIRKYKLGTMIRALFFLLYFSVYSIPRSNTIEFYFARKQFRIDGVSTHNVRCDSVWLQVRGLCVYIRWANHIVESDCNSNQIAFKSYSSHRKHVDYNVWNSIHMRP